MTILNQRIKDLKSLVLTDIEKLLGLTKRIDHEGLIKVVNDLKVQVSEPFMFVIVGEVKAGKSSFINALLQSKDDICKVAPSPMTDTIQQIIYGENKKEVHINPFLKKIHHPLEILKEIAIVDTPGTNTIIAHHQEITVNFIPSSDLIVFVFEAKNPYRQSAWDFFDFINAEWRKKIIFVLQQKDLMNEEDLKVNVNGVKDHALKKGIESPTIFAVSAKMEKEGQTIESGFAQMREYISQNITGGKAPFLKVKNIIDTGKNINERIASAIKLRKTQYEADLLFRTEITDTLAMQEEKSVRQVEILIENLLATYDRITNQKLSALRTELSFFSMLKRSVGSIFSKEGSIKKWLEQFVKDLEYDMNNSLKDRLQNGVVDIADSIQQMAKIINFKIRSSETILKDNHEIFSAIAERRANVLRDLQKAFSQFLSRTENFYDEALVDTAGKLGPNVAAGSGIAIVGVILTALTNTIIFDITGGVLTTVGLLFAGVSVGLKKRKITNGFKEEISKGRRRIENEVNEKLTDYINRIKRKIEMNFDPFDMHLNLEKDELVSLETTFDQIETSFNNTLTQIDI